MTADEDDTLEYRLRRALERLDAQMIQESPLLWTSVHTVLAEFLEERATLRERIRGLEDENYKLECRIDDLEGIMGMKAL